MTELVALAQDIIQMRKFPLKNNGMQRYPAAQQAFAAGVAACDDPAILRGIIAVDTGHVLPSPIKQRVYEKLLAMPAERDAALLRAFAMHLVMFGYTDADGNLNSDVDAQINALYQEAEGLESR